MCGKIDCLEIPVLSKKAPVTVPEGVLRDYEIEVTVVHRELVLVMLHYDNHGQENDELSCSPNRLARCPRCCVVCRSELAVGKRWRSRKAAD